MIINSVRNILQGFGASSIQGGLVTQTGAPTGTPLALNPIIQFAAGKPGISVGYAKVRVSAIQGASPAEVVGLVLYGGDGVHLNAILSMQAFPAGLAPPNGWEGDFVIPFVGDYQYNWFSANVIFDTGVTTATVDFEVWGNAMAGGQ